MPRPRVSIVVPTLDRPAHLLAALASIERTVLIPSETIVVMVAGDEATRAGLDGLRARDDLRIIEQSARGGAVAAMNLGLRAARGEYLMQINDDCELLPHSVANAIRFLEVPAHASVGQAAFFHNSPVTRNIHQQIQLDGEWYHVCHVRGLCYANFGLARRSLYERLDYLDERYFMYAGDPDFSLKVWYEAKMEVRPCPGALVRHLELDDERGARERAAQAEDNAKLFAKWGLG